VEEIMDDEKLIKVLVCVVCRSEVVLKDNKIVCKGCGRKYPVRDGIPIMLEEEAELPDAQK
jgi:uncharacterized protein YbaR (Trm112 family)